MGNFKGKIFELAKEKMAAYRQTGAWLQDSVRFKPDYRLDERNRATAQALFNSLEFSGYKQEQKFEDFETLLANLLYQDEKPISISLNKDSWRRTQYNKIGHGIIDMVKKLKSMELIDMKIGYNLPGEPSRLTRIWATERLYETFPLFKAGVIIVPTQLVILHDSKGKLKPYKDTAETHRIRKILGRLNQSNGRADIRYREDKLNANLVCVFNEELYYYGRLHTRGFRHYQGFTGEERREITINGDSTVELDFSGLHPNLLYAAEGIQYAGDPYSVVDDRPEVRLFLKAILLRMLNSKNEATAERAANKWLVDHPTESKELKALGITRAQPFINQFLEAHKPIAHYFCKGRETGMRIMNKDSKIALEVVDYFGEQGISILCIHDSFIVQTQHRGALRRMMKQAYRHHTKGFEIKVK